MLRGIAVAMLFLVAPLGAQAPQVKHVAPMELTPDSLIVIAANISHDDEDVVVAALQEMANVARTFSNEELVRIAEMIDPAIYQGGSPNDLRVGLLHIVGHQLVANSWPEFAELPPQVSLTPVRYVRRAANEHPWLWHIAAERFVYITSDLLKQRAGLSDEQLLRNEARKLGNLMFWQLYCRKQWNGEFPRISPSRPAVALHTSA